MKIFDLYSTKRNVCILLLLLFSLAFSIYIIFSGKLEVPQVNKNGSLLQLESNEINLKNIAELKSEKIVRNRWLVKEYIYDRKQEEVIESVSTAFINSKWEIYKKFIIKNTKPRLIFVKGDITCEITFESNHSFYMSYECIDS